MDTQRQAIELVLSTFFDENYDGHFHDASHAILETLRVKEEHAAAFPGGLVMESNSYLTEDEAESMVLWNPGMRHVARIVGRWEPR